MMSLSIREDGTQIIRLEEIVIVKQGMVNVIEEYILKSAHLLSLIVHHSC